MSLLLEKFSQGLSYDSYFEILKHNAELTDFSGFPDEEKDHLQHSKINLQRTLRNHKTFSVDDETKDSLGRINKKQYWLIITEEWCGDSAQNVPHIVELAKLSENVEVRLFQRDKNLDLMDLYLTNGSRSIPKLISFDKDGNEIFRWGPRPAEANKLIAQLKTKGKTKEEFTEQLHLWYAKNKGINIQEELLTLINQ